MELYHVGNKNGKELSRYQIELNEAHILAKNGLLSLSITVGLKVLNAMMSEEVKEKAGKRVSTISIEKLTGTELNKHQSNLLQPPK